VRHSLLPSALATALLLVPGLAPAARTSPLDAVRDAAAAKGEEIGLGTKPATKEKRALGKALEALDRPRDALKDDLRAAGPVCRLLDGAFPGDPALGPALDAAIDLLRDEVLDGRASLLAWTGRLGSFRSEDRLLRGVSQADGLLSKADEAADRSRRARSLFGACRVLERTREALDIQPPGIDDPPFAGLAPDFSLEDVNPDSATAAQPVSPRDYPGMVTAWYFVRTT